MGLNTTPRSWAAGEIVTAAMLNTEVRDALIGLQAAWTAYTPTTTGITLGTGGTATGAYLRMGKTIFARVLITLGTGGVLTGTPTIALPAPTHAALPARFPVGLVTLRDSSPVTHRGYHAYLITTSTFGAMDEGGNTPTATVPWTWAADDQISASLTYEAA